MGNCHFKTDFDAENITGKFQFQMILTNANAQILNELTGNLNNNNLSELLNLIIDQKRGHFAFFMFIIKVSYNSNY